MTEFFVNEFKLFINLLKTLIYLFETLIYLHKTSVHVGRKNIQGIQDILHFARKIIDLNKRVLNSRLGIHSEYGLRIALPYTTFHKPKTSSRATHPATA